MSNYPRFVVAPVDCPQCGGHFQQSVEASRCKVVEPNVQPQEDHHGNLLLHVDDVNQVGVTVDYAISRSPAEMEYPERERVLGGIEDIAVHVNKSQLTIMSLLSDIARGGK